MASIAMLGALGVGCGDRGVSEGDELPIVGILRSVEDPDHGTFLAELRARGWARGRDVLVEPQGGADLYADADEARAALRGWVREGVDVIVTYSTPLARVALEETSSIPVVVHVNDPVSSGLIADPLRPEGNVTGVTFSVPADRTLDLGSRVLGGIERLGYLAPSGDPAVPSHRDAVLRAAELAGIQVEEAQFAGPEEVAEAVARLAARRVDAVYLASSTDTARALDEIGWTTADARLPVLANTDLATFAVTVITPDRGEVRRQIARQVARLLSGSEVAAVPVESPRKFVVILDTTAIARLGYPAPPADLLRQADLIR